MVGTVAGRHPHRTRALGILFSHRHLHYSQHRVEFALLDLPALGGEVRRQAALDCQRVEDNAFHLCSQSWTPGGSASPEDDGKEFAEGALFSSNGKSKSAGIAGATRCQATSLPALPAHAIDARFRWRNH